MSPRTMQALHRCATWLHRVTSRVARCASATLLSCFGLSITLSTTLLTAFLAAPGSLDAQQVNAQQESVRPAVRVDSLQSDLDPSTTLEALVKRVAGKVIARYEKPWGRVVERHRSRVYIVPQGTLPEKGQQFLVMRQVPGMNPSRERLICKLKVHRITETLVECRESDHPASCTAVIP